MGLRPAMLDDLGLGPALQYQAREFSRRYDVPVTVHIDADLSHLDDAQRTAIYRIVQESLTNCARHAHAKSVEVGIRQKGPVLDVTIADDGVGCGNRTGLGLLGMQERVRALGGSLTVVPGSTGGTLVRAHIPVAQEALAHA
jgi:signal transduction histidine kinase